MRIALLTLAVVLTASPILAHPGGLAADGCHYCRTNCAAWGVEQDARHCHEDTAAETPPVEVSGQAVVIDADTIAVRTTRIRLYGIDAPESGQTCRAEGQSWPCGEQATEALTDRIGDQAVQCEERDRDSFGRIVAVCQLAGQDLNAWLVAQGWAMAYRQFSEAYVAEEAAAAAAGRGIWRGQFVAPWEWRRGARLEERVLENPRAGSMQSGLGVISGWVCETAQIEIEFTHGTSGAVSRWTAGYPTSRGDTRAVCEDDGENGFSLLFNWNLLGAGRHLVRALADGAEFARRSVTASTLGLG
ncbi:MAG: thermonuclease family protein, partial [Gemmatimonadota bacterium]|nr:thermonuclease family protein [Gemmatimonadota bacterium]